MNNVTAAILAAGTIGVVAALLLCRFQYQPSAARLHPNDGCLSQALAAGLLTFFALPMFAVLAATVIIALTIFARALTQQGGL